MDATDKHDHGSTPDLTQEFIGFMLGQIVSNMDPCEVIVLRETRVASRLRRVSHFVRLNGFHPTASSSIRLSSIVCRNIQ
jgi:hypothetical protein